MKNGARLWAVIRVDMAHTHTFVRRSTELLYVCGAIHWSKNPRQMNRKCTMSEYYICMYVLYVYICEFSLKTRCYRHAWELGLVGAAATKVCMSRDCFVSAHIMCGFSYIYYISWCVYTTSMRARLYCYTRPVVICVALELRTLTDVSRSWLQMTLDVVFFFTVLCGVVCHLSYQLSRDRILFHVVLI